jgi:hypothetical protein
MPFFADTNICSKCQSDAVVRRNWELVKARLESQGHAYVACPLVLIELLARLIKPEPKHFSRDLKSFLFLADDRDKMLPFPAAFVAKTVLNIESRITKLHAEDFSQMLQCVVSATSREDLGRGDVDHPGSTLFSYGIDFDKIRIPQELGKQVYARQMQLRRQKGYIPTREDHAEGILSNLQAASTKANVTAIANALDAAFHYQRFLLAEIGPEYDYFKNASDWADRQLLYYLADPNMHIVTNDAKIKHRCSRSKQSERVVVI